jgi:hypothetical protein
MNNQVAIWTRVRQFSRSGIDSVLMGCAVLLLSVLCLTGFADAAVLDDGPREQYVPVLCLTMDEAQTGRVISIGKVIYIVVLFTVRDDAEGLDVHFTVGPGRFSVRTQAAAKQAIANTARVLGLSSDSWDWGHSNRVSSSKVPVSRLWSVSQSPPWREGNRFLGIVLLRALSPQTAISGRSVGWG